MTLFREEALNRRRSVGPDICGRVLDAGSDGEQGKRIERRRKTGVVTCKTEPGTLVPGTATSSRHPTPF